MTAESKLASPRYTVPGSDKAPLAGARLLGAVRADERVEVSVRLRPKTAVHGLAAGGIHDDVLPTQRQYLSREAFAESHGADPKDIEAVTAFARTHGLAVVETDAARRTVVLTGGAKSLCEAFGVELHHVEHDGGTYRGRSGVITVPGDLGGIVEAVLGLDDRPQADPHFRRLVPNGVFTARAAAASFTPVQLAKLYDFPVGLDGSGQCIGIIELGGGYRPADLTTYFAKLGLKAPTVKAVLVDGGHNSPTNANGADGEVMLDIEVAAAIAPKATIAVYFAPNTDQGFLDAITTAVHDTVNKPSVISISWGSAESSWTVQSLTQFDQAFQAAAALGVTICCAAGDNGSADAVTDGKVHVDFPASSPNVLGCGGTRLAATLTATSATITSEVVWNEGTDSATGGGVSAQFPLPAYQKNAGVPVAAGAGGKAGRGVPDVAGDADPQSGYQVRVDGQDMVIGGTSAVAPLWAGLIALMNQKLGKPVGFLNPLIYGSLAGKGLFRDITSGNNGAYKARVGWDPCTGWGSPDGAKLLKALGG